MNTIAKLLMVATLAACGGTEGYEYVQDENGDTVELQQALTASKRGSLRFGTRTSSSSMACDNVTAGQVCAVPASIFSNWSVEPSGEISNADLQRARLAIHSAMTNFVHGSFEVGPNDPGKNIIFSVNNVNGGVCAGGSSSANIESFGCLSGATVNLTEDAGTVGSYVRRDVTTINIDLADIDARGLSSTLDARLLRAVSINTAFKARGVGGTTTSGRCTDRSVQNQLGVACTVTESEKCAIKSFSVENVLNPDLTHYGHTTTDCGI